MTCNECGAQQDEDIHKMIRSRKGPAVLKITLAGFRSIEPSVPVFAFEGIDDKTIYHHWICKIRPDLKYEPFPCNGKGNVLEFREMIDRDLDNIGKGVYFFIDRDFDDLRGHTQTSALFITDAYSVENYLITETVVDELLKNEFHCHAQPLLRSEIINSFTRLYSDFLTITREINNRLFIARRLKIELVATLTDKVNRLASISIDHVTVSGVEPNSIVKTSREPTEEEIAQIRAEFDNLDRPSRYRGKFSLLFFMKWLSLLADNRNSNEGNYFPWEKTTSKVRTQLITLDCLASKSALPVGLKDFILAV